MKYLNVFILSLFASQNLLAQEGLEGIILETYYITEEQDAQDILHTGELTEGSVTYRIYVDLQPGYSLQAVYGNKNAPLRLSSTAPFYNHVESGQAKANIIPKRSIQKNTLLLDSWLTIGAAGEDALGIPKKYDTDGLDTTQFRNSKFLKNSSKACSSLWAYDGMVYCETPPFTEFFQMDSALYQLGSSTNGHCIEVSNGAWASMGRGVTGADSLTTNSVLIAQLTTKGILDYKLNLMIRTPQGKSIKYTYLENTPEAQYHPALSGRSTKKNKRKRR